MKKEARRIERHPAGILPQLVALMRLRKDASWRPFAIDDFIALVVLTSDVGLEGLDANAMGMLRGFKYRAGLRARMEPKDTRARLRAYLSDAPLPPELVVQAETLLDLSLSSLLGESKKSYEAA